MIKIIIFDLGGVIVSPEVEKIPKYTSDYAGIDYIAFSEFYNKYKSNLTKGKASLLDVYSEMVKQFQLDNHTPQEIVHEHLKIFKGIIKDLDEEVLALVQKLKKNYKVVCLVNAESDVVPLVRKGGLYGYFHHAYISTEMGMEKPDAEIYLAVLNDLNCKPEETIFIDDKEPNVDGAKRLGMQAILYKTYRRLKEDLNKIRVNI